MSGDVRQNRKLPRRHSLHLPQCPPCQPMPTRSPFAQPSTRSPTVSTTPATSCPGTRGYVIPGMRPSFVSTQLCPIPFPPPRTRTWPGPGAGMSRSTISSGPPARDIWTTRILDMLCLSSTCRRSGEPGHVDTVRRMLGRHELHPPGGTLTRSTYGPGPSLTDDHCKAHGRRKRRKGLPHDVLGQDRLEDSFPRLVDTTQLRLLFSPRPLQDRRPPNSSA